MIIYYCVAEYIKALLEKMLHASLSAMLAIKPFKSD